MLQVEFVLKDGTSIWTKKDDVPIFPKDWAEAKLYEDGELIRHFTRSEQTSESSEAPQSRQS